jgi:sulfite reductase alpha subunit-like flavoprotein
MAKRDARVTVLYASQTGTGQEIARSIQAECAAQGMPSEVMSMNELGFDNLRPDKTPLVVFVASSTGKQADSYAKEAQWTVQQERTIVVLLS